ncbi:hypothetical protein GCM10020367_29950 [Streptomyces sannanensis]|uniref:Uncharacterized protein n=1 Tax=Streptomyces sannanensis TaxID=285536 RepID=A0ABP6SC69_9ACTN
MELHRTAPPEPEQAAAEPTSEAVAAPASDVSPRSRPRGRTTVIIAVAALLGVVGGTAVGYRIQADRPPTSLPPLNQPGLAYPAKPLPKDKLPEPLSAAEDMEGRVRGALHHRQCLRGAEAVRGRADPAGLPPGR